MLTRHQAPTAWIRAIWRRIRSSDSTVSRTVCDQDGARSLAIR
jgi:hypothetical protein